MKKTILILPFLAFFTFSQAQVFDKLRLGLIFSNAVLFPSSDNVDIPHKASYGFDYGVSIDYFFTDNYAISTGAYMNHPFIFRKNSLSNFADSTFLANPFVAQNEITTEKIKNNKEKITSMELNIPVSFKLKTNEIGYFKYFGDIGVLNTFRIQSRYSLDDTKLQKAKFGKQNEEMNNLNFYTNLYNFSLKVGGGIEYTISDKTALVVGLYFYNGFTDYIQDNDNKATYMRKLSLRTGILF